MVFQQSEIVCLFLALAFAIPAALLIRMVTVPHSRWFFAAVFLAIGASIFTVLEHVALGDVLNILEHICYSASALTFAAGCWFLASDPGLKEAGR
jgi:hypothetical protein